MENKKRVTVLVIIAVVLAITAISMSLSDSEIPTNQPQGSTTDSSSGIVGLVIGESKDVEDRGNTIGGTK